MRHFYPKGESEARPEAQGRAVGNSETKSTAPDTRTFIRGLCVGGLIGVLFLIVMGHRTVRHVNGASYCEARIMGHRTVRHAFSSRLRIVGLHRYVANEACVTVTFTNYKFTYLW